MSAGAAWAAALTDFLSTRARAMAAGAFDYVPKPFNNDEVREMVRRALRSR